MQRLIDLSTKARMLQHFLTLNQQVRLDLVWWNNFLPTWNGHSFFLDSEWSSSPDMNLFTDASLTGYGAFYGRAWLLCKWVGAQLNHLIAWKELAAIIMASLTWGDQWKGKRVLFHCDNQTIVYSWQNSSSRSLAIMGLLRRLLLIAAKGNFAIRLLHVPGTDNSIADAFILFTGDKILTTSPTGPSSCNSSSAAHPRSLTAEAHYFMQQGAQHLHVEATKPASSATLRSAR